MARVTDDASGVQSGSHTVRLDADAGARLSLPSNDFVTDAQILRDGQDLILRTADGHEVIVGNYFNAEPAPVLVSAGGAALTPELVDSFVKPADGVQMAQKGSVDDSSPVGMVREVSGEAIVTHPNGITEKISAGTPIYQGDIVETKADGAVNIIFVDETTFAVSKDARLAIDEYVFDPATQSGETNFSVLRGVFVFTSGLIGREDPDDVQIDTPVGSIGIRGTTIMGTINPEGQSYITVVEGAIVVRNGTGEQTLSAQYETVHLDGYDSQITNDGTLSASQIGENYNVLRTVNAELFSQIDDTAASPAETEPGTAETGTDSESAAQPENAAPGTESAPDSTIQTAPEKTLLDAPSGSTAAPAAEESTAAATTVEPLTLNTDAGFDLSAGTTYTFTSGNAATVALTPPSAGNPLSTTATTANTPLPPMDLSNQTTAAAPVTGTSTTTTPPPYDLLINNLIAAGGADFIPNPTGGTGLQQGMNIAALGDYNHDGVMDFAFTNKISLVLHMPINSIDLNAAYGVTPASNYSLSYLGDINGDGYGDVILGTPGKNTGDGQVTVFNANNPAVSHQINGLGGAVTQFGTSVAGIGDFNGDGYNDILVGAPTTGGGSASHSYIVYGRADFYSSGVNLSFLGTNPSDPDGFALNGTTTGMMGRDVAGLQDFNGDGFSDIAIARPGDDTVSIMYGSNTAAMPSMTLTGISATNEIGLVSLGDINGGGRSDLGIYEQNTDTLYVALGENANTATQTISSLAGKVTIISSAGTLEGAGAAGDFNGDGFNDFAVASRNGQIVDVYVIYGSPSLAGSTIDLSTISKTASFQARIDLGGTAFDYTSPAAASFDISLTTMGDRNGDGFDDLMIGLPNIDRDGTATHYDDGGVVIVNGRADAQGTPANVIYAAGGAATATASSQTLVGTAGNDILSNGVSTNAGTHFVGGGGNDLFTVFGGAPLGLNGGTGIDTVEFMTGLSINLNSLGENLSGIERIKMSGAGAQLTLGIDDVFRLLEQSQNRTLTIEGDATTQLHFEDNTAANPTTENLTAFGFAYTGDTNSTAPGGYNAYAFGSYTVFIGDSISPANVQVV